MIDERFGWHRDGVDVGEFDFQDLDTLFASGKGDEEAVAVLDDVRVPGRCLLVE